MIKIASKSIFTFMILLMIPSSFEEVINGVKCRERERLALLKFKSQLDDYGSVSTWGTNRGDDDDYEKNCCKWDGVFCDNQTNHVVALYLGSSRIPVITGKGNINMSSLELPHLNYLDLSRNDFNGTQFPEFICSLGKLRHLNLVYSGFVGQIPHCVGNLTKLQFLDLSVNWLSDTNLDWLSGFESLEYLDLSRNNFQGTIIPDSLGNLTSLRVLHLSENILSGRVPKSIRYLSQIDTIMLGSNRLEGLISEVHLFNLSKLKVLDFAFNSNLTIRTSSSWNPPFQLESLYLASCKLGPYFPRWLQNQKRTQTIDISNAKISDSIPNWFWENIQTCVTLDMSYNQMYGVIPNLSSVLINLVTIDLRSNEFNGSLPLLPPTVDKISFSRNRFSGKIFNICYNHTRSLRFLDLSDNLFSTHIPQRCFMNLMNVDYLNLANNNFFGEIPNSIDLPCGVSFLHLRNNSFTGEISRSLKNCSDLAILDLGKNNFTGEIPDWLGQSLPGLGILSLKSNNIHGSLPRSLCQLQNLQVLDISVNNISGTIPECLKNFTKLRSEIDPNLIDYRFLIGSGTYDSAYIVWKRQEAMYSSTLRLLTLIDLSSNNIIGEIPHEVVSLVGLVALNLSRNNLVGSIPSDISHLELLNFLDFSKNKLSGSIPPTLAQLNHLGVLDLSFNNLSGKIPWSAHLQTFDASIYMGNPGLCGPPLVLKPCPGDKTPAGNIDETHNQEHDDIFNSNGFYVSMALGFIIAFWGVSGTLFLNKWCRITIGKVLIIVEDWLYVKIMISRNRLKR
ncbi:Leucine-rich repeat protein [Handroanthus impetiginosus]|uniref:Leucine-rich repeat protein n=1 Tax=Handroanthus impetiginosus TaxID=429701 RepID=A0A2G9I752_9LAMI|nr:Leucine-rich repeat protein [Handroanthus impetiginosus]